MQEKISELLAELKASLAGVDSKEALQELRVKYLGKKGEFTAMMKQMGSLSAEERPKFGQLINSARGEAETLIGDAQKEIDEKLKNERFLKETIDGTFSPFAPLRRICEISANPVNFNSTTAVQYLIVKISKSVRDASTAVPYESFL